MSLTANLQAKVRTLAAETYADTSDLLDMTPRGDLCIAPSLPPKSEMVRMGQTWTVAIDTSDAFTYVNAWPTTRAELVLYNGESNALYLIDSAWMVDVTSAAAAQSKTLLAQMGATGIAAPTDNAALLVTGRSGRGYGGNAKKAVANTAFAVANKWEVLGVANNVQAASIGAAVYADLYGGWIVPPGRAFCLAGVASTAAGTAIIGVTFHVVSLPTPS